MLKILLQSIRYTYATSLSNDLLTNNWPMLFIINELLASSMLYVIIPYPLTLLSLSAPITVTTGCVGIVFSSTTAAT